MSVAGYNHHDVEDCLGIEASEDRTVATVYIGQAYDTTEIELTLDELRAFSQQVDETLNEMEAKRDQGSAQEFAWNGIHRDDYLFD